MTFTRTANAGGVLTCDGVSLLLDGVCNRVAPYLETPLSLRRQLLAAPADAALVTHAHPDHCDSTFLQTFLSLRPVYGPEGFPHCQVCGAPFCVGAIQVTPVPLRHLGKPGQGGHLSYLLEGTERIWFMGDGAPFAWEPGQGNDILFAPFAYANSEVIWKKVCEAGFHTVVVLHMPDPEEDCYGLWDAVQTVTRQTEGVRVLFPKMGETVQL